MKSNQKYMYVGFIILTLLAGSVAVWLQKGDEPAEEAGAGVRHTVEVIELSNLNSNQKISAVGRVHSFNEAELSAEQGGIVRHVNSSVGDTVFPGQILVQLETGDAESQLIQAEASLAAERARLEELLSGERPERLSILQSAVANAEIALAEIERQTQRAIDTALKNLLNTDLRAYLTDPTLRAEEQRSIDPPVISGVYEGVERGEYRISLYRSATESGYSFNFVGPEGQGAGSVNTRVPQPLGKKGLYILFPENFSRHFDLEWVVPVPNDRSPAYISARDAYERAVEERGPKIEQSKGNLNQLQKELSLLISGSRVEQADAQRARVRQAEAMVAMARNSLARQVIRAPFAGEVLSVSARVGENVSPGRVLISIANDSALKLEVFVSPDKARLISIGNDAEISGGYKGIVLAKASGVDPRTGQVEIQIGIGESDGLLVGEYREAGIIVNDLGGILWMPLSAVRVDSSGSFVFAVEDGKVVKLPVQTGEVEGENVSILSGLEDSPVVIKDSRWISAGMEVDIKK